MVVLKKIERFKDNQINEKTTPKTQFILKKQQTDTNQDFQKNTPYIKKGNDIYQFKDVFLKKINLINSTIENKNNLKTNYVENNLNDKIIVDINQNKLNTEDKQEMVDQVINDLQNKMIEESLLYEIEKKKLEIISNEILKKDLSKEYKIVKEANENVDELLDDLNSHASKINDEETFIEFFSFLDEVPKKTKISYSKQPISHLYAKLDEIEKKGNEIKNKKQEKNIFQKKTEEPHKKNIKKIDIVPLIEKIEIPNIISINDDTKITEAINKKFIITEKKSLPEIPKESTFIDSNKKLKSNPVIDKKMKELKIKADVLKMNLPSKTHTHDEPLHKMKNIEVYNYLLPKDYLSKKETEEIKNKKKEKINLIYTSQIDLKDIDLNNINEKYNIDEFSFVNIYQKNNFVEYKIVQPELTKVQEKTYHDIKKTFFDTIDTNYFSFKKDKNESFNYIKKIFDLTLNKTTLDLTNLEKKLYFNFILQDFSGLGFLTSILEDKNILEINCMGAEIPIMAYHIKYGLISTNLIFENIFQLNTFVLSLAKLIGLRLNPNNPIINGNLPNGYKVEGLYSVGDTSNKGSSFIIKKYLEKPLTPVNLINLGIGTIDVFSYIWSIINLNYQIIIVGEDDVLFFNTLAQLYPNKNIVSIQSYDYFKFPQKNWIKREVDTSILDKNLILNHTFSERPDYIFLDSFTTDIFENKWYNISLTSIDKKTINDYIDKVKNIGINSVIIYLDRIDNNNNNQIQISKIIEIKKGKEDVIIKFMKEDNVFHINLVPSEINVVDFFNKKKMLRWAIDADIYDYLDFNNIVTDYNLDKNKLFKKLNISEKD